MAKYSILIPMYNAEKHITECISSIIKQSYIDFECIVVDDGSSDHSSDLVKKCIGNDRRFKLHRQNNMGVAKARENLINKATGEYIVWVDSDDYVVSTMLETLNTYIDKYQADALVFKYSILEAGKLIDIDAFPEDKIFSNVEIIKELAKEINMPGFLCNKVFKKSFYANDLFKDNFKMLEDYYIMPDLFSKCDTIVYVNSPLYIYRQEEGSITHNLNIEILKQNYIISEKREGKMLGLIPQIKKEIGIGRAYRAITVLNLYSDIEHFDIYKSIYIKDLRKNLLRYILCRDISAFRKIGAILLSFNTDAYFFAKRLKKYLLTCR